MKSQAFYPTAGPSESWKEYLTKEKEALARRQVAADVESRTTSVLRQMSVPMPIGKPQE